MTEYEIIDLLHSLTANQIQLWATYTAISTSVLIGAYIAGKRLDWVLALGIAFLYSWVTIGVVIARMVLGNRQADLTAALIEAGGDAPRQTFLGIDLTSFLLINTTLFYATVWGGVVFFIFYARKHFGADD